MCYGSSVLHILYLVSTSEYHLEINAINSPLKNKTLEHGVFTNLPYFADLVYGGA